MINKTCYAIGLITQKPSCAGEKTVWIYRPWYSQVYDV